MLRIHEIKLKLEEDASAFPVKIAKKIGVPSGKITRIKIHKESIDARNKEEIRKVYSLDFLVDSQDEVLKKKQKNVKVEKKPQETYEYVFLGERKLQSRPVVVGFGPCGMFAALILAQMGFNPLVLERGKSVEERSADVEKFWKTGILDETSNVQFGEGGAGTFSDGKLNTGIKDIRIRKMLEELVEAGADDNILYKQKPHIGTDVLRTVVKNMRKKIESLGGEIRFGAQVTNIKMERGKIKEIEINGEESIPAEAMILAIGHSARDTFEMLKEQKVSMEAKPFSLGVRIEHKQEMIDESQLGDKDLRDYTGAAEYKISYRCADGRGVYTFCMCPGGFVVASASEKGRLVTNGMSFRKRDGENANSALLVGVDVKDFDSDDCLAGVEFQRKWEERAFALGGSNYCAPAQTVADFMNGVPSSAQGSICPTYTPGVVWTDLNECLPDFVSAALKEAIPKLAERIAGFDTADAVLTAIETRSSSPVRIIRGDNYQCNVQGIYPAGEGSGYAGGITSSAVDGIKAAERLASLFSNSIDQ